LDDPEFYITRSQEATHLVEQIEKEKAIVAALYARWEELEALRAQAAAV